MSKVLFLNGINLDLAALRGSVPCSSLGINIVFVACACVCILFHPKDRGLLSGRLTHLLRIPNLHGMPDRSDSNPEIFSSEQTAAFSRSQSLRRLPHQLASFMDEEVGGAKNSKSAGSVRRPRPQKKEEKKVVNNGFKDLDPL